MLKHVLYVMMIDKGGAWLKKCVVGWTEFQFEDCSLQVKGVKKTKKVLAFAEADRSSCIRSGVKVGFHNFYDENDNVQLLCQELTLPIINMAYLHVLHNISIF